MHEAVAWYYNDDRTNSLCWHMSQMCWHYGLAFMSLLSLWQFVFFFPFGSMIQLAGRKGSVRVTASGAAEVLDVGFRNRASFRVANGQGQCWDWGALTFAQRLRLAQNRQVGFVGGPGRAFPQGRTRPEHLLTRRRPACPLCALGSEQDLFLSSEIQSLWSVRPEKAPTFLYFGKIYITWRLPV